MDIQAFAATITQDDAKTAALRKGSPLWRFLFASVPLSEIRQQFVEYKIITFEAIHRPTAIQKLFNRNAEIRKQTIRMLANGSTGSVAWIESMPDIVSLCAVDPRKIQRSDQNDEAMINRGRKVALRVIHRFCGGIPELEVLDIQSVYRPFWIALYGDTAEGSKARYMPIAADGCGSHRSF